MGSRGRPLFDLNEPPAEDNDEQDDVVCFQPQKAVPSSTNSHASDLFPASAAALGISNNNAFSHASTVSGFQPFVRPKSTCIPEADAELKGVGDNNTKACSSSKSSKDEEVRVMESSVLSLTNAQSMEREEGEWSDAEGSADVNDCSDLQQQSKPSEEQAISGMVDGCVAVASNNKSSNNKVSDSIIDEKSSHASVGLESDLSEQKSSSIQNSEINVKNEASKDVQEEPNLVPKQKEVKGIEASHALRCANNLGKRKIDQRKEEMLGKKRNRQTMFLNLEDVKQAGPIKTSTPRRQSFSTPATTRTVKEVRTVPAPVERVGISKDQKQVDTSSSEGGTHAEEYELKSDCNGDNSGLLGRPRKLNSDTGLSTESNLPPIPRQSSWKQPTESRQQKNVPVSNRKSGMAGQSSNDTKLGNKKHLSIKKPISVSTQSQDTSVERLIREVTSEKFWHNPGMKCLFYYFWSYYISC